MENWRKYLTERLNYENYYVDVEPRWNSDYENSYCEYDDDGDEECHEYGKITDIGVIRLMSTGDNRELMSIYLQKYSGYLSHNQIQDFQDDCDVYSRYDDSNIYCVSDAIRNAGLRYSRKEIYSGSWTVAQRAPEINNKFLAGALSVAFCETVIALVRDHLNGEYFAYHQVVHPGATTSPEAQKLTNYAVKKGFLEDVRDSFEPRDLESPDNWEDYQVFKITTVAQTKFRSEPRAKL
jgi:hypothetical protein